MFGADQMDSGSEYARAAASSRVFGRSAGNRVGVVQDVSVLEEEPYGLMDAVLALWRLRILLGALTSLIALPLLFLVVGLEPRYTASASILVDPREINATGGAPLVVGQAEGPQAVASAMQLLSAPALLRRVVHRLDLEARVGYGALAEDEQPSLVAIIVDLVGGSDTPANPALEADEAAVERAVNALSRQVRVLNADDSRLIEVRVTAGDPLTAAALANAVAHEYVEFQNEVQGDLSRSVSDWIDRRTLELRRQVEKAENEALRFRIETLHLVDYDREALQAQLDSLVVALADARQEVARAAAEFAAAQSAVAARGPRALLAFLEAPLLERLAAQATDVDLELIELAEEFGGAHPRLDRGRSRLAAIRAEMESASELALAGLSDRVGQARSRQRAIETDLRALYRDLEVVDERLISQRSFDREVEAAAAVLESFVQRLRQTEDPLQVPSLARIVSPATAPLEPSQPMTAVLGFASLLFAGIVSTGTVLVIDQRRRDRVLGADDVRRRVGLPVVGRFPTQRASLKPSLDAATRAPGSADRLAGQSASAAALAAAFLAVAKPSDGPPAPVFVTATHSGAGRTTVLCAAAARLVHEGRRVMLLDLEGGLAAVGAGYNVATGDRVNSPGLHGLSVRLAGPDELLKLALDKGHLEACVNEHDLVLIDAPTVESVVEPVLSLARRCRTVLVATQGRSIIENLRVAAAQLDREECRVVGVILNRARDSHGAGDNRR